MFNFEIIDMDAQRIDKVLVTINAEKKSDTEKPSEAGSSR
jgi:CBS domain containing-hemolysin-like protein